MPIRYYEGIEGSGKTAMMTRDSLRHYQSGGQVLSFPGYDLKGDNGETVSRVLLPEEWLTLPDSLKHQHIVIDIDEVTNWFNNLNWYNKMCTMMAGLMGQRRKFEVAIFMTGPHFSRLPPVLREMVHEIVHCQDNHARNHNVAVGERCIYYKEDLRGLLSERWPRVRYTRRKIFYTKPYWKNYDTYQAVDLINQFIKVRFKAKEITIGPDGRIINSPVISSGDPEAVKKYLKENPTVDDVLIYELAVKFLKTMVKEKGVKRLPRDIVYEYFKAEGSKSLKDKIGSIFKSFGVRGIDRDKSYDFSSVEL